ncbi:MAG TPA: ATP-binding protein [Candidatus Omnitrophota bacterium]|nr:ATP-binding protein [Candidatus Omnitrophota bacterium]HPS36270.1 ATP-binding protein [Candidatus Omnitrophota bacterium]
MKTNPLGDLRAELDQYMLDHAFYETSEYRSLIEESKRRIVVGRRGTGKSALHYKLKSYLHDAVKTTVIDLTPGEADVIGLRSLVSLFGEKQNYLRAACNIAWQYAVLNEILVACMNNYKLNSEQKADIRILAQGWSRRGESLTARLYSALEEKVDTSVPVERRIAALTTSLGITSLQKMAANVLDGAHYSVKILADRLDDGYEPDSLGVAILTGLLYALDQLSTSLPRTTATAFLRDNIFRAIQLQDPDYSRNIEGDVLRLHWDEQHLLDMICSRIQKVFNIENDKSIKVWNAIAFRELSGMTGFRRCLRQTLYRPRDLIVLMNRAFNHALSNKRNEIYEDDIDVSAREISCSRLDDLKKEYEGIVPGLSLCVHAFAGASAKNTFGSIEKLLYDIINNESLKPVEIQTLKIFQRPEEIVKCLFSVGFLGVWKNDASSFVFCHDGKDPDFLVVRETELLVHPCYWIALNLEEEKLPAAEVDEIHDEYDIEVSSETPEIRKKKLGQLMAELAKIPHGDTGATEFEEWCLTVLKIVFAGGLVSAELHPNKNATQRRDVVARNNGKTDAWQRILHDYGVRQVIFEIKNFSADLGPQEYRQMLSYLTGEYGRLGFIVNRAESVNLEKGKELDWVREIYHEHERTVVIKLPAKALIDLLSKLRSPERVDAADKMMDKLLDTYERLYFRLGATPSGKKK